LLRPDVRERNEETERDKKIKQKALQSAAICCNDLWTNGI
jgi:hypothetical protein